VSTRGIVLTAVVAFIVYALHAAVLGSWIVDDAGISFAYARSLAEGYGLTAQSGVEPVEGFTNLLWVLLLAGVMKIGLFDLVLAPKLIAGALVLLSFLLVARLVCRTGRRPGWLALAALVTTALISGFAIWTASGLENALYVCLLAVLAWWLSAPTVGAPTRRRRAAGAGLLLFLIFCARPDGILYFWLAPFILALDESAQTERPPAREGWLGAYLVWFLGPWLLLTLLRLVTFADVLPNTFYAKQAEGSQPLLWLEARLPLPLVGALLGVLVIAVAVGGGWVLRDWGRRLRRRGGKAEAVRAQLPLLFLLTGLLVYHVLRGDWMPLHRFATPVLLFGPAAILSLIWSLLVERPAAPGRVVRSVPSSLRRGLVAALAIAMVAGGGVYGYRHTRRFLRAPTISLQAVQQTSRRIAAVLEPLGARATVLTPDIGGALWEDRYQVVDLVGLVDRTLGRELDRDPRRIAEHILTSRLPDAVYTHSHWLRAAGLAGNDRFAALYAPARELVGAAGAAVPSGLFLRRSLRSAFSPPAASGDHSAVPAAGEMPVSGSLSSPSSTVPGR
jgi:hypothetical protein